MVLQKSFDKDDDQVIPRLYLLREYWRGRQVDNYRQLQRELKQILAPRNLRSEPNLIVTDADDQPITFKGVVRLKEADYLFAKLDDGYPDVFIHRSNVSRGDFDTLQAGSPISFTVGFNTRGAAGTA